MVISICICCGNLVLWWFKVGHLIFISCYDLKICHMETDWVNTQSQHYCIRFNVDMLHISLLKYKVGYVVPRNIPTQMWGLLLSWIAVALRVSLVIVVTSWRVHLLHRIRVSFDNTSGIWDWVWFVLSFFFDILTGPPSQPLLHGLKKREPVLQLQWSIMSPINGGYPASFQFVT